MNIHQLRYFLVLAKELHFWKSAEKVHLSQSSLSRQIQSLEDELGVQLLKRNKRNVKLTEAGTFLQKEWSGLLDEFDRVHQQAKRMDQGISGRLSIAYPGSITYNYLPDLLHVISHKIPEVTIELQEPTDEHHENLLLDYKVDVSFGRDAISHNLIHSKQLYSEDICLVVPKAHPLTVENFTTLSALKSEKFILSGLHHTTYYASLLRQLFINAQLEPHIVVESDFGGMIINLVAKGLGISILPYSFFKANNEHIRFIPLDQQIALYLNWRKSDQSNVLNNLIALATTLGQEYST